MSCLNPVSDIGETGCRRDIKPALDLAENGETIYIAGPSMSLIYLSLIRRFLSLCYNQLSQAFYLFL